MSQRLRSIAIRRLKRDLVELQAANFSSIAARPLDTDLFEWHVNIKPTDGVYVGVYFHLIMVFPDSYPTKPPTGIDIYIYIRTYLYTHTICTTCNLN